jgi:hypothetical protein
METTRVLPSHTPPDQVVSHGFPPLPREPHGRRAAQTPARPRHTSSSAQEGGRCPAELFRRWPSAGLTTARCLRCRRGADQFSIGRVTVRRTKYTQTPHVLAGKQPIGRRFIQGMGRDGGAREHAIAAVRPIPRVANALLSALLAPRRRRTHVRTPAVTRDAGRSARMAGTIRRSAASPRAAHHGTYSAGLQPAAPARRSMAPALPVVRLKRLLGAED